MNLDRTYIAFRNFARKTQKEARANLTRKDISASGNLRKELKFYAVENPNSVQLVYERPIYADFQDLGVSGKEKKYKTRFTYRTKKPPASVFEKWAKQRKIKPRNKETGRFITFKSFGFAMSNHIYRKGISPKGFFITAYKRNVKGLPEPILDAFNLDVNKFLEETFLA